MRESAEEDRAKASESDIGARGGGDAASDHWPQDRIERERMIAEIDRLERKRLRRCGFDAVRLERVVDLVTETLLRRLDCGDLPLRPRAWFRKVVDHLARSPKISAGIDHVGLELALEFCATPEGRDAALRRLFWSQRDWLKKNLDKFGLTSRQCRIVRAVFENHSMKAAAATLGMNPSNFRRDLDRVAAKISARIELESTLCTPDLDLPPPS